MDEELNEEQDDAQETANDHHVETALKSVRMALDDIAIVAETIDLLSLNQEDERALSMISRDAGTLQAAADAMRQTVRLTKRIREDQVARDV